VKPSPYESDPKCALCFDAAGGLAERQGRRAFVLDPSGSKAPLDPVDIDYFFSGFNPRNWHDKPMDY